MEQITPAQYRNGILNLMIDYLSVTWAKPNIMVPYGGLNDIPDADLPGIYSMALLDAAEVEAHLIATGRWEASEPV